MQQILKTNAHENMKQKKITIAPIIEKELRTAKIKNRIGYRSNSGR